MPATKPKIVALVGPTGSGKTEWAKKLAQKFGAKIISADSRQIYKEMDIGTGKDKSFKQDLIDIVRPTKKFSVWDFQRLANGLINRYLNMKNLPILVGGTGLYLYAVLYGYVIPNLKEESEKLREKLAKIDSRKLYDQLKKVDSRAAANIDPRNKRRLIRALEISLLNLRPSESLGKKKRPPYKALIIGIKTDRQTLYAKIDARIDRMIKNGWVEEARNLLEKYRADLPAFSTIGYKEIIDYLKGRITLKEAIKKIKANTHDYVRRQETWFRKNKDIKWVEKYEEAEKLIKKFLNS